MLSVTWKINVLTAIYWCPRFLNQISFCHVYAEFTQNRPAYFMLKRNYNLVWFPSHCHTDNMVKRELTSDSTYKFAQISINSRLPSDAIHAKCDYIIKASWKEAYTTNENNTGTSINTYKLCYCQLTYCCKTHYFMWVGRLNGRFISEILDQSILTLYL